MRLRLSTFLKFKPPRQTMRCPVCVLGLLTFLFAMTFRVMAVEPQDSAEIFSPAGSTVSGSADASLYLEDSEKQLKQGNWNASLSSVQAARSLQPDLPGLDLIEGQLRLEMGEHWSAIALLSAHIADYPDSADALMARAEAFQAVNGHLLAAQDYRSLQQISESPNADTYELQARALLAAGDEHILEARYVVDVGLRVFPEQTALLGLAVDMAIAESDWSGAQTIYAATPWRQQLKPQWRFRNGLITCGQGQSDSARQLFLDLMVRLQRKPDDRFVSDVLLNDLSSNPVPLECWKAARELLGLPTAA